MVIKSTEKRAAVVPILCTCPKWQLRPKQTSLFVLTVTTLSLSTIRHLNLKTEYEGLHTITVVYIHTHAICPSPSKSLS